MCTTDDNEATVNNLLEVEVAGVWIPYPLPSPSDGCKLGLKCPATKSTTPQQETVILPIPAFTPPVSQVSCC